MLRRFLGLLALVSLSTTGSAAVVLADPIAAIDRDIRPYADTRNFSGAVLVARGGKSVFGKAYGFADREKGILNQLGTRFYVASMSMQFTAAAALRLINAGKLELDTSVSAVVPDYPNGQNITIRHLLTQTSGIANINDQPDYNEVLKQAQTPLSLVNRVRDLPPKRPPGTYEREEHSAYNLLALIIERKAGVPFAQAVRRLVFQPLGMNDSGIDDDRTPRRSVAIGYQPKGVYEIEPAPVIHWSAKTGNASAYTTVGDELKFVEGLFNPRFLRPNLRETMFDLGARVGYGWFKSDSKRFGQPVYSMNGRAPGFASAVVYVPEERLFVAAFSNIYASVPADMVSDIAALVLGKEREPASLQTRVAPESLAGLPARFQFSPDFYQPSAVVRVSETNGEVSLQWPGGVISALIPVNRDRFIDRSYWVPVELIRDGSGKILALKYDRFTGQFL